MLWYTALIACLVDSQNLRMKEVYKKTNNPKQKNMQFVKMAACDIIYNKGRV